MTEVLLARANVITMDPARPSAEAVLIRDSRIRYVGTTREASAQVGAQPRRIDLAGRTILPGFNDNHIHTVIGGDHFEATGLADLSAGEIVAKLREDNREPSRGGLITGYGWDYPACPNPHRRILDEVFPDNPVIVFQFGGHGAWANSRALSEMAIDRDTPDPPLGTILRDEQGEPTGILREMGSHPYMRKWFMDMHTNPATVRRNIDRMTGEFHRLGITSVQDNTWFLAVFRDLLRRRNAGALTTRFNAWIQGEVPWRRRVAQWLIELSRFDDTWVRRGPYKYFLDGTFSTRSAWLTEAYADEPGNFGKGQDAAAIKKDFLEHRVRRKQTVACHAIGDRAVKEFLDAVEELRARCPWVVDLRLRLEHAQLIREEDVPRLRRLGVLVSAQPHAMGTPEKDAELLGDRRAERVYPYRWLLDEGVHLSFGSDFPGELTLDPLHAIALTASRPGPQRITVAEALHCYTGGSAYAEAAENDKGSLTAGKLADLVVLSGDPLTTPAAALGDIRVEATMVGGRVVHGNLFRDAPSSPD
jgi:predicted amidohydrolase YtcJ